MGEARPEWEVFVELAERVRPDLADRIHFASTSPAPSARRCSSAAWTPSGWAGRRRPCGGLQRLRRAARAGPDRSLEVHSPEEEVLLDPGRRSPQAGIPDYNAVVSVRRAPTSAPVEV